MITKPALLIIDVQNDVCHDDGQFNKLYNISRINKAVTNIRFFINHIREIRIPLVYIKSIYGKYLHKNILERYKKINLENLCSTKWRTQLFINPKKTEKILVKHAFTNPKLDNWLRKKKIETLILIGFQTHICIDSTARSGFMKGYKIVVIDDCVANTDLKEHKRVLNYMVENYGAEIRSSGEKLKKLASFP